MVGLFLSHPILNQPPNRGSVSCQVTASVLVAYGWVYSSGRSYNFLYGLSRVPVLECIGLNCVMGCVVLWWLSSNHIPLCYYQTPLYHSPLIAIFLRAMIAVVVVWSCDQLLESAPSPHSPSVIVRYLDCVIFWFAPRYNWVWVGRWAIPQR